MRVKTKDAGLRVGLPHPLVVQGLVVFLLHHVCVEAFVVHPRVLHGVIPRPWRDVLLGGVLVGVLVRMLVGMLVGVLDGMLVGVLAGMLVGVLARVLIRMLIRMLTGMGLIGHLLHLMLLTRVLTRLLADSEVHLLTRMQLLGRVSLTHVLALTAVRRP